MRIDARHAIAHNKVILIDEQVIITGSFNFSKAAKESNAENLLVIRDQPRLMAQYLANFRQHQAHSEPPQRRQRPLDEDHHGCSRADAQDRAPRLPEHGSGHHVRLLHG
ncbi:MAG: hypothetical protein AMXMBFR13_23460 [Phycisphaerae bacterium]